MVRIPRRCTEGSAALAAWLRQRLTAVRALAWLLAALPGALLAWRAGHGELGVNPLETLSRSTGDATLWLLGASLGITPLRHALNALSRPPASPPRGDWNWLVRLRRMLGLWCFAYALVHAWLFVDFDQGYDWRSIGQEAMEKPYLFVGALALLGLTLLAATSPKAVVKRLGRHWTRLHRLIYAIALLALLHYWWLVKPGLLKPLPETLWIGALLLARLIRTRPRQTG